MSERDYSNDPDDYNNQYPNGQAPGGTTPPTQHPQDNNPPSQPNAPDDPYANYNGGSPPNAPLKDGYGWEWTGSRWVQVQGRGLGFSSGGGGNTGGGGGGGNSGGGGGAPISGVPTAWNNKSTNLQGSVPTLADAIRDSKQLQQAPTVNPYAQFQAPTPVGLEQRNSILNSVLNRPQIMDQTFQDQLFEQGKELQNSLAGQSRERLAQAGASSGRGAGGGFQAAGMGQIEGNFMNQLLAGKRNVATKAAEVNRASELAAVQMQEAISQGDYVRAQSAYETQLKAQNLYDELRFKAAEFDRANVALAAQVGMAGRQQQLAEQTSSFQQYLEQLKFEELMRQFNEQIGLDYGKFGWNQQMDIIDRS